MVLQTAWAKRARRTLAATDPLITPNNPTSSFLFFVFFQVNKQKTKDDEDEKEDEKETNLSDLEGFGKG